MATVRKIIRVRNPRKRRVNAKRVRMVRNKKGRFVKRSTVRAKARNTKKAVRRNPVVRRARRATNSRKRVNRRRNPIPVLIELGAVNPRRRKHVATTRRRKASRNPRRRHVTAVRRVRRRRVTRRRNPVAIVYPRRRNRRRAVNHRRRHYGRRRNPSVFGQSGPKGLIEMGLGGLVGVAATKFLPTLVPASLTSNFGTSALVSVAMTGAGAFTAGFLAKKFVGDTFGNAVLFGGLMQTFSTALNAFVPASIASQLALSGVGDIIPGMYVVPQNPIKAATPMQGVGAFRGAFGGRR